MNKKPIVYIQKYNKDFAFDFCYSAFLGAKYYNQKINFFEDSNTIDGSPYNIIIGSVEQSYQWLEKYNYNIEVLYPTELIPFLNRASEILDIECAHNLKYPFFIKPFDKIKAFTGFIANNKLELNVFSEQYNGNVIIQEPVDFRSEYRLYIHNHIPIGLKHYSGDYFLYPDKEYMMWCLEESKISYRSYVMDFGVLEDGSTVLVECNDGWSIGNYGLCHLKYYQMLKDRWLQITGILK